MVETNGWAERGSPAFAPRGLVVHHTASARSGGNAPSLRICIEGRADLPGPLCQVLIGRDGTCYVIAAGRANHAGTGGYRGLSGNTSVFGIEAENDGRGEPWSPALLDAFHRASAVLLAGIGRDQSWCCAHREWTPRKIDPAGIDMGAFRAAVGRLLAAPQTSPATPPQTPVEDGMAPLIKLTDDDRVWLVAGMARRHVPGPRTVDELVTKGLARPVQVVSPEVLALYTEV